MIFQNLWNKYYQVIHITLSIIGLMAYVLHIITPPNLPIEISIAINLTIFIVILNSIAINVHQSKSKIYQQELKAHRAILDYIENKDVKVKKAILIQYSGQYVLDILNALSDKRAKITLWLKDPTTVDWSVEQRERIERTIRQMRGQLALAGTEAEDKGTLDIFLYDVPGAFRGMLLDDELLVFGSYTYEYKNVFDSEYPNDLFEISGHDRPCILLDKWDPNFTILKKVFNNQIDNFTEHNSQKNRKAHLQLPPPQQSSGQATNP